eukprot:CAMPEP_0181098680 /NCGR_PEP_ID=MMETSP1071-20121207/12256_1 /TAXON_ID=35127 /ORGANISM="Thalassiosira sp., Strain NH16" /LENGTH=223 /DNA_ID=CAMNT_0023181293 /DNA_START=794 /DNA_END=1465 /DNA_ORIENTATION=-
MTLLPWFHEFQMNDHVGNCDDYLAKHLVAAETKKAFWKYEWHSKEPLVSHQSRKKRRKETFGTILNVLELARRYDLIASNDAMGKKIAAIWNMSVHTHDLFDFDVVKSLLPLVLPLEIDDGNGLRMKLGGNKHIWPLVEKILSPHISRLSQETIDDSVSFPHLFYSFVLINVEKERMQQEIDKFNVEKLNAQNEIRFLTGLLDNNSSRGAHARFKAQQKRGSI